MLIMAKTTKYIAQNPIVRLNGKNYEVGATVTGLKADQEERLQELGAIKPEGESEVTPIESDGEATSGTGEKKGE
jgi:hypothetical protein